MDKSLNVNVFALKIFNVKHVINSKQFGIV